MLLKLKYVLVFIFSSLFLKAQNTGGALTQVVSIGSEMTYRIDVENVSSNTNYHWNLLDKRGNLIKEEVKAVPYWTILYSDSNINIRPGEYKIVVYADNYNNECKSGEIELNIKVIDTPVVKIKTDNTNGFCSFTNKTDEPEEFVFEVGIEGYFGDWIVKYKVLDNLDNEIIFGGEILHEVEIKASKAETISILLGDEFINKTDLEKTYSVKIEEVILVGGHGTPTILNNENKGKFRVMPIVKIGNISTIKME